MYHMRKHLLRRVIRLTSKVEFIQKHEFVSGLLQCPKQYYLEEVHKQTYWTQFASL